MALVGLLVYYTTDPKIQEKYFNIPEWLKDH